MSFQLQGSEKIEKVMESSPSYALGDDVNAILDCDWWSNFLGRCTMRKIVDDAETYALHNFGCTIEWAKSELYLWANANLPIDDSDDSTDEWEGNRFTRPRLSVMKEFWNGGPWS